MVLSFDCPLFTVLCPLPRPCLPICRLAPISFLSSFCLLFHHVHLFRQRALLHSNFRWAQEVQPLRFHYSANTSGDSLRSHWWADHPADAKELNMPLPARSLKPPFASTCNSTSSLLFPPQSPQRVYPTLTVSLSTILLLYPLLPSWSHSLPLSSPPLPPSSPPPQLLLSR